MRKTIPESRFILSHVCNRNLFPSIHTSIHGIYIIRTYIIIMLRIYDIIAIDIYLHIICDYRVTV